ncbi:MAG: cache domain-containing protein [Candidatus Theseobacter exili]|nr:cache domain-containing protein [Candidatus Theseobacter exili]
MLRTFRSKFFLLIFCIIFITTAVFVLLSRNEVEKTMLLSGEDTAKDMLHLVALNVANEYKSMNYHKKYALNKYKQQLKNVMRLLFSHLNSFYSLYEQGLLSEEQAQQQALESVRNFIYGNDDYFYIYNKEMMNLSHPDPKVFGKDMNDFVDVHGTVVGHKIREIVEKKEEGFLSFWFVRLGEKKPSQKISYNKLYEKWNWIVGTGVYIDEIESDAAAKYNEVIDEMAKTFSKITIGQTGYFFVFDDTERIIVHPLLSKADISLQNKKKAENKLLKELIHTSGDPDKSYKYKWETVSATNKKEKKWKEAFVKYFDPLKWYITASVYIDEMKEPAKRLVRRQLFNRFADFFWQVYYVLH